MKLKFCLITAAFLLGMFTSCSISENATFKPDGSGEMEYSLDMGEFLATMNKMGANKKDSTAKPNNVLGTKKSKLDTVIYFKDVIADKKDSIEQLSDDHKAIFRFLEDCSMKIKADQNAEKLAISLGFKFKDLNQVPDLMRSIEEANKLRESKKPQDEKKAPPSMKASQGTKVSYKYSGKKFARAEKIVDKGLFDKSIADIKSFEKFYSSSTFSFNYTFPKAIKKVNVKGAKISADKKSFSYSVPYLDYLKNPEQFDILIEF